MPGFSFGALFKQNVNFFPAMDQQVCHVIGQDENGLYGIACNNRAYMRKTGPQGAWYGIEKQAWESAKTRNSNINANLVLIEENYAHDGDPELAKTKENKWGGKLLVFSKKADLSIYCSPFHTPNLSARSCLFSDCYVLLNEFMLDI